MSNEEIYEKAFFSTEVPPQNTFERRVALTAMEAARKDEAENILKWVEGYSGSLFNWKQLYQIFKTQTNG